MADLSDEEAPAAKVLPDESEDGEPAAAAAGSDDDEDEALADSSEEEGEAPAPVPKKRRGGKGNAGEAGASRKAKGKAKAKPGAGFMDDAAAESDGEEEARALLVRVPRSSPPAAATWPPAGDSPGRVWRGGPVVALWRSAVWLRRAAP